MSSTAVSPLRKAWLKWKSLHLPWRKRFLVGLDLQGNTFWEFRDTLSSHKHRMRRIVQYPPSVQYSDLNISPQWHQWLRHTRQDPPSITEQSQDVLRQKNLKVLAAQADARWAAKPSYLDAPGMARGQALPATVATGASTELRGKENANNATRRGPVEETQGGLASDRKIEAPGNMQVPKTNERTVEKKTEQKEDPWKTARGGPSEEWTPKPWDGNKATARR